MGTDTQHGSLEVRLTLTPAIGIDISAAQATVPEGGFLFIVHKATEGHDYTDPQFASRFPTFTGLRGAYHYARPGDGFSGVQQADFFVATVLRSGFVPGVDLWQLDCEGTGNETVDGPTWTFFVNSFMREATQRLGARGFLYVGAFFEPTAFATLTTSYPWWLPDYGVNDGSIHPLSAVGANPVIHQFSSAPFTVGGFSGPLDRNVINDEAAWERLVPPKPRVDLKAIAAIAALLKSVTLRPVKYGDKGKSVAKVNGLLVKRGFKVAGDAYGVDTAAAVASFKRSAKLKNRDGKVCGRACLLALLK